MRKLFGFSTLIISFVAALSGCVSILAQKEAEETKTWCEDRMRSDPAILPLRNKIPIANVDEITPEMLAIPDVPTDEEVQALKAMFPIKSECQNRWRSLARKYQPMALTNLETTWYKYDLILAALIEKKMTYGNANRLAKEAYLEGINRYTEQSRQEMVQARQVEMQRAQILLQAGATMNQQTRPAPTQMQTTNCRWIGQTLNCTSF